MKIGILIIFRNDENIIDVQKFIELFSQNVKLNVCLVNNESTDNTFALLKEIQEEAELSISVIDVKKNRGHDAAVKAGIRYLNSAHDLPFILCLKTYVSEDFLTLEKVFASIQQEKGIVTGLFQKTKRIVQKNVFSLRGVLEFQT
ncbi:N-glycosyltransferase [Kordia sp. SMS9]|uniref:glycosyltransferase n=1 Tax=Kordia sp. SMS9 TaxID=2282170 RepID=UPI000E0E0385|nr:glycosyltransferase [Kordia sp. SMS9]AXG68827.1 N-glycosyltransferase [Kordia sp. SMS9]